MKKYYYELNEKEQKEAIKEFEKYIKSDRSIIDNIKGCEPLQYCYTSSSSLAGVFLPNNEITLKQHQRFYDFVCIGKNENNQLGLWLGLKSEHFENGNPKGWLQEYIFIEFVYIDYHYFDIKNKIIADIKELKEDIKTLESVKLVSKKNGDAFSIYNKNFEYNVKWSDKPLNPEIECNYNYRGFLTSIDINFNNYKLYHLLKDDEHDKFISLENYKKPFEMYRIIQAELLMLKERLTKKESILKNSLKYFLKAEKIKKEYIKKKSEFYELHYFNEYLQVESYETER